MDNHKDVIPMKKFFRYSLISLSTMLATLTNVHATSYQIFSGLNFSNPAALNSVKKNEFILGGTTLVSQFGFNGTAAGIYGTASSSTTDFLPYGRFAMRASPKVVVSLDITQPYYTDILYPNDSIVNLFATQTVLRDTNFSPKISYQVNDRLALGIGFDANNLYDGQLSFVLNPNGNLANKASSWGYGWDVGLFYVLRPTTFLNLSYYSKIVQHARGTSTWGSATNNSFSADAKLPATYIANIIQMLSAQWALSGTARYTQWNTLRYTVLQNTAAAAVITVPDHFYNNVSLEAATRYQVNTKWAVLGAFDYEPNVQPTFTRNVGLPTYTRFIPALGAEYEFVKGLKGKFVYAYVYSRPPINMTIATGQTITGRVGVNANAFDLSLIYDV